jgi:hypothetical protein
MARFDSAPSSQVSADSILASREQESLRPGRSSRVPTAEKSSNGTSPTPSASRMCERSALESSPQLTESLPAFPVSPFPSPDVASPKRTTGGFGRRSLELSAIYDLATSSWRTLRHSLLEEWETYSETFPRWAMTRSGRLYLPPQSEHPTFGTASGLLPTPVAKDDGKSPEAHMAMKQRMKGGPRQTITSLAVLGRAGLLPTPTVKGNYNRAGLSAHSGDGLYTAVQKLLPTPTKSDGSGGPGSSGRDGGENLRTAAGGPLNPEFVEWMMGFPQGWTSLHPPAATNADEASA